MQRFYSYVTSNGEMTDLLDKGRAMDIAYLEFRKAFDPVSHKILTEKVMKNRLDEQTGNWTEDWANDWNQRVVISGTKSNWKPVPRSALRGQYWI